MSYARENTPSSCGSIPSLENLMLNPLRFISPLPEMLRDVLKVLKEANHETSVEYQAMELARLYCEECREESEAVSRAATFKDAVMKVRAGITFSELPDDKIQRCVANAKRILAQAKLKWVQIRTLDLELAHEHSILGEAQSGETQNVAERRQMRVNHLDLLSELGHRPPKLNHTEDCEHEVTSERTMHDIGKTIRSVSQGHISSNILHKDQNPDNSTNISGQGAGSGHDRSVSSSITEARASASPQDRLKSEEFHCYLFDNAILCTSLITFDVSSVGVIQCTPVSQDVARFMLEAPFKRVKVLSEKLLPHAFQIVCATGAVHTFQAGTKAQMNQWHNIMQSYNLVEMDTA